MLDQTPEDPDTLPLTPHPPHPPHPPLTTLSWTIHNILCTAFGVLAVCGYVWTNNKWESYSDKDWVCALITVMPLVAFQMLLSVADVRVFLTRQMLSSRFPTLPISIFLTTMFVIAGLFYSKFHIFQISIFFGYCSVSLGAAMIPSKYNMQKKDSVYIHLLIFFILAWSLDLRWYSNLLNTSPSLGYDWWALAVTILGITCWGVFAEISDFGYSTWPIKWRELMWAALGLIPFLLIIIPLGILSGFLKWNLQADSFWDIPSFWIENFTTVAVTEELYFRAVLLNLIHEVLPSRRKWVGVILSSIVFGLWHTPRRTDIGEQAMYILLSFIAGCIYSAVYILGGNNLLGSSITHSIVDTVWEFALRN